MIQAITPIPVIGTGMHGLVGSRIQLDLKDQFTFEMIDINHARNPVDITKPKQLEDFFAQSQAGVVLHCAAFTDVTAAWEQTDDESGPAFQINVVGTKNIVEACNRFNKHLIHLSTAYVFDGAQPEPYTETDSPNPIEWYGQTKLMAEEAVQSSSRSWTILRIDQPFRSDAHSKLDIVHKIMSRIVDNTLPPQFTDHTFGPTFIDDFSQVVDWAIKTKTKGLFHASSGEQWDDFAFASTIAQQMGKTGAIQPGSLKSYLKQSARPYQANTALNVGKLKATSGINFIPIRKALAQTVQSR